MPKGIWPRRWNEAIRKAPSKAELR